MSMGLPAATASTTGTCATCDLLTRAVPDIAAGRWALAGCSQQMATKQLGKRLLYCTMTYVDAVDAVERSEDVVLRVAGRDRGTRGYDALVTLWDSGFRAPSLFRVPRPYGHLEAEGVLVLERVHGTLWADHVGGAAADLRSASERAARWLLLLQHQDPGTRPPTRAGTSALGRSDRNPQDVAEDLARDFPQRASSLRSIAADIDQRLAQAPADLVASHGDFHPSNVILGDDATTVIDFDTFGARAAAFDVGYAIGQLLVMSQLRLHTLGPGAAAAAHLWKCYSGEGSARWAQVRVHVARTLLQSLHYELVVLRNGRVQLLDLWSRLIALTLAPEGDDGAALLTRLQQKDVRP